MRFPKAGGSPLTPGTAEGDGGVLRPALGPVLERAALVLHRVDGKLCSSGAVAAAAAAGRVIRQQLATRRPSQADVRLLGTGRGGGHDARPGDAPGGGGAGGSGVGGGGLGGGLGGGGLGGGLGGGGVGGGGLGGNGLGGGLGDGGGGQMGMGCSARNQHARFGAEPPWAEACQTRATAGDNIGQLSPLPSCRSRG